MIRSRNAPAPAYEKDFVAWLEDQARRARRGEGLDLENVAEQLEGWRAATGARFAAVCQSC